MARYVLVEVDENDRADRLIEKLEAVPGLRVVGLFGKPTQFCECEGPWEQSKRGKKYGWYVCPACGFPRKYGPHQRPKNLLWSAVPETMQNIQVSIREPYETPLEAHGQDKIDQEVRSIARTRQVIADYWAKQSKRSRRVRRLRARR